MLPLYGLWRVVVVTQERGEGRAGPERPAGVLRQCLGLGTGQRARVRPEIAYDLFEPGNLCCSSTGEHNHITIALGPTHCPELDRAALAWW
jgi:hypothetical protein